MTSIFHELRDGRLYYNIVCVCVYNAFGVNETFFSNTTQSWNYHRVKVLDKALHHFNAKEKREERSGGM